MGIKTESCCTCLPVPIVNAWSEFCCDWLHAVAGGCCIGTPLEVNALSCVLEAVGAGAGVSGDLSAGTAVDGEGFRKDGSGEDEAKEQDI